MKPRDPAYFVPRDLYTAADAERVLGIPAGLVRKWALRRKLYPMGLSADSRPMYDKEHLRVLWEASPVSRRAVA